MFCPQCGKENQEGTTYCGSCGYNIGVPGANPGYSQSNTVYIAPQKSTGLGIILSVICVGLGHLYAGLITKGLLLIVVYTVLWVLMFFTFFITAIIAIVIWIWAIYDTNKSINQYNEHVRKTGNPPW